METEEKQGYCTLCRSRCGTINVVAGDRLISVRPDPSHPTGQAMCMKGRAAPELVHSPHRLRYPMRRTRAKGDADPGWVRISWEEALAETAARLAAIRAESGAEAVVFPVTTPSGTPLSDSIDWIERFVHLYGSPNICYATEVCNWHKDFAHAFTFGRGMPTADYAHADLILLWGHNPANVWLSQADAIGRGRKAGARMMVVDPRRTALAAQADRWLQVRPGADAALALGLIHLLIEHGGFDDAFVRNWTNAPMLVRGDTGRLLRERDLDPGAGTDRPMVWDQRPGAPRPYDAKQDMATQGSVHFALRGTYTVPIEGRAVPCHPVFERLAQACAAYTPDHVARLTWVAEAEIRDAAALIARSRRIAYHSWTGIGQHGNATQTERAVAVLYALTGSFDVDGGNRVYRKPPFNPVSDFMRLDPAQRAKALGLAERPLGPPARGWVTARDTYRAILDGEPYRVRAMLAFGANPLVSQADTEMGHRALRALEFHVHCDLFETPTNRYADILLPVNTPWEREGLRIGFEIDAEAEARVQLRPQMVTPRGEARSDNDIVFDLAVRLGMGDAFFGGSLEAGWNHMLAPLGLSVAELRRQPGGVRRPQPQSERQYAQAHGDDVRGFATESRRVELYSELLLRHGYAPLPRFDEPADSPFDVVATQQGRYPYVLTSAKNGYYCHSQHRSLVSLRKRAPQPRVALSATLAAEKGIADGDWVRVATRNGTARFVAQIDASLKHAVVVAEFGWWQACPELGLPGMPARGEGAGNFNALISADHADPISGAVPHRSFLCDVMLDPCVAPHQRAWRDWRAFRVAALRRETEDVLAITFAPCDGGLLPDYLPGQHVSLRVVGDEAGAAGLMRAYSLTGPAQVDARRTYTIVVRHQRGVDANGQPVDGAMSGYLHRALKVGHVVELRAPSGSFVLPRQSPQPVVLVAGGIGITPFLGYLESLCDVPSMPEVWLHYANRNSAAHAFRARLAALRARLPRLRVIDYYDAPLPTDAPGREFDHARRVDADVIDDTLIARRARFYLCGPQPMMRAVTDGLVARGVPAFDIFSEVFRSPAAPVLDPDQRFRVDFVRSARTGTQWTPARGTLLEFAEQLGLSLSSGCRVGQCESCAVRIAAGQVRHLHGVAPDDPATCLACQAVPVTDLVLEA